MTSTMGIMTLSRGPCDLDNMSLFQDLKLKRRKVDSRCSSDGESAADTSTSSPDPGPPSPRMADAGCSTPPHPPPVFDGGGSPSPSPAACHPTVIRSAPPNSVIKFEGAPAPIKIEVSSAGKHDSSPSSHYSSVKLEGPPPDHPHSYRSRALAPPPPSPHASLSPNHWPPAACINGVKPELIGGHFPPQPLEPKGARSSTQWRGAPAVIMGESGGVRTMFWTLPAPTSGGEPSPGASHTPTPPASDPNTCSEESAARLLLNLGGELRRTQGPRLNMELLWAGDVSQLPAHQQIHALNLSAAAGGVPGISNVPNPSPLAPRPELRTYAPEAERDEDEQPMICMICEDKATGLHYGIITCEGCKGFFKRTVQNRRVYTCVADGGCEITKAQRNRCQYCRFKKCIEQGMVLQAVREDRMPGGRNSGAVYNLYKVKYKKHKKPKTSTATSRASPPEKPKDPLPPLPPNLVNGTILKTALTNPSEVVHLRARLESAVSSSRDRAIPLDRAMHMIRALIDCDAMEDIATVRHLPDLLHDTSEIGDKLCKIGDSIVHKMVAWTKKLPFIMEIPMEIHSKLLMEKWHEISVLTTAAYQAMHGKLAHAPPSSDHEHDFMQEVNANLRTLQNCLTSLMGRPITLEQLRLDVGLVVEKMTQITCVFRRIQLRMEEYVCLKVYILLNQEVELEGIQDRYVQVLRSYLEHAAPHHPGRLQELFARIPEIQAAANLLLESKMFYVPFVLNSAEIR
ncbi:hormone receptor 4 isoform X2 [Pieris rapae]|uniref:hormone receptor 4 isoform X2 n=1 Tax=Pieris rapae TaxID=64459 RepID=UPI000B92D82A|nr:hormone receptor 4 isoform X2 [Pieris rapae]XP_045486439.1 hormone receptor 4 isoform X2 [Pieris rapae]